MDEVLKTQWLSPQESYMKGSYFGDRALTHPNEPRGGTAICTKACRLAVMSRSTYEELLLRMSTSKQIAKNNFLKGLPMFSHWPVKQLNKLQENLHEESFIRGQTGYCEGDSASDIYLIHTGEFLLTKKVPIKEEHSV